MEANEGARWVIQNSNVITAYANRFLKSAPYEMRDYMQEAFIASLKAYKQFPNTTEDTFRRAFWRLFKDAITETVPRPDKTSSPRRVRSNESMSIPSSVCISDDDGFGSIQGAKEHEADLSRFIFIWLRPALTEQESIAMNLLLGLGNEGALSENEIAEKLGVSRTRVRGLLTRSINKTVKLSKEADTKKILLMMINSMKEYFKYT